MKVDRLDYDVVISGAGPAGSVCAMALEKSGLRVALLDKSSFPRDKICGDFIAAMGLRELYKVNPHLEKRFEEYPCKVINRKTRFIVGNGREIPASWVLKSYTIRRQHFDNILLEEVLNKGIADFYPESQIVKIRPDKENLKIESRQGHSFSAKMIIGADGAHSIVAKLLAGFKIDRKHYGGSVRAYYTNVKSIDTEENEVYVHKKVTPGYFWLFPVSPTEANVGLGMQSKYITSQKIDLKSLFFRFIEESPLLQQKLGSAQMLGKLEGFGLPFYSKRQKVSGDRFLLTGDAASMIDPSNGEGIMQAMVSGRMAAEFTIKCFEQNRFDEAFTQEYARLLHNRFWREMKIKSLLVNTLANKPWLIYSGAYLCDKSPLIKRAIQKLM